LAKRKLPQMNQPVKFCLILVNQKDPQRNIAKYADHKFTVAERDWGFREFVKLELINRPEEGFLVHDCLLFTAQVTLVSEWELDNPMADYNSRKATGYVGLKNQGATCYMNSLLQTLFHLGEFRRAVYRMPVLDSSSDNSPDLLTYALQRVFYDLQYCPTVVKTKRLTDSFGWDNADAFTQHDVQELNRILCDALEEKMKREGIDGENTIQRLFEGKMLNYIRCIHVPYESSHMETFYDLSLNVRGCADIYESFEKYTEVEIMDGDNKYRAEGYQELQAAKKGSVFISLPPVLQLHLKRFEYDFARDMMVKINDHYKFYETIDLNKFVRREDSMEASNVDYTYELHSVLVHMGDIYGGHYYAFIRPNLLQEPESWYKFDDDLVLKSDKHQAIEENFGVGGEKVAPEEEREQEERDRKLRTLNGLTPPELQPPRSRQSMVRRLANAYMLQYVRRDKIREYLTPLEETEVPRELIERLEKEKEEEALRKKERMEAHLYCTFMVVTDQDLLHYRGTDLIPRSALYKLKVRKSTTLKELKDELFSRGLIKDPSMTRIWRCFQRDNDTIRTQFLLAGGRDNSSVLEDVGFQKPDGSWEARILDESVVAIFVEDLLWNDGMSDRIKALDLPSSSIRPHLTADEILLFFKLYTPFPHADYRMIGKQLMNQNDTVENVLRVIKEMLGEANTEKEMLLFEEISPRNVQRLDDMSRTLKSYKIGCGDIIVIQPAPLPLEQVQSMIQSGKRYLPTVWDFLDYLMKRVDVEIRNILEPHKAGMILDMMITDTYELMRDRFCKLYSARASDKILEPEYVRFFPMDAYRMQPRSFPLTVSER
jgi:ubiquitin carboxyl-terminal hydrolase 7